MWLGALALQSSHSVRDRVILVRIMGFCIFLIPSPPNPRKHSLREAHLSERFLFSRDSSLLFCRQFFCVFQNECVIPDELVNVLEIELAWCVVLFHLCSCWEAFIHDIYKAWMNWFFRGVVSRNTLLKLRLESLAFPTHILQRVIWMPF